jgi:Fic family protein
MVYIYRKQVGHKSYYYLRLSKRHNGKQVTKDLAYLGNNIEEARKNFSRIAQQKQEIRKSYRKINLFLEKEYYKNKIKELKLKKDLFLEDLLIEIESCKLHFQKTFDKLDSISKKEILEQFAIEFAYNTTSLEGNTITLEEARNFFENKKTPANKELREIYDLQNTKDTLFWILKQKKEIDENFIIDIHKRLMTNIDNRIGFRKTDLRVTRSRFDASPGIYVNTDIKLLLKWYNSNKNKLHPLVLASIFHHKFEKIHPFSDGNGRTGRMLMNYILIKSKYPPAMIHKKNRTEYLDALGSADEINLTEIRPEYKELIQYTANEMIDSYWNIFL